MYNVTGADIRCIIESIKNKKVILYGSGFYVNEVIDMLKCLDIIVEYCVDDDLSSVGTKISVKDVYSLILEDDEFYVLIVKKDRKRCAEILEGLGLKFLVHYNSIYNAKVRRKFIHDIFMDVNLGYALPESETDGMGVKVLGDLENAKYVIAVLGNSTSEPCVYPWKSWAEYMWEMNEKDWAVIIGAVSTYATSAELIKLIRDMLAFSPDYVVSYSGINDILCMHPYVVDYYGGIFDKIRKSKPKSVIGEVTISNNICYGVDCKKSRAEIWINNQRIMHAISNEFGIGFKAFFQPSLFLKKRGCKDEEVMFYEDNNIGRKIAEYMEEVKKLIKEYDFIVDAKEWMDDIDGMFYDHCHVNEEGNKLIANMISKYISEEIV